MTDETLNETLEAAAQAIERWDEGKQPFTRTAVASVIRSLEVPAAGLLSSPASPQRYGCKQCQRDFDHEPFTVSIGGIPARTYFFCTTICRERWNMGYTGEPPQMPKPEQVIRVAENVRAEVSSPASQKGQEVCESCRHLTPFELTDELFTCPVVNIRIHRDSASVFGCNQHEAKA